MGEELHNAAGLGSKLFVFAKDDLEMMPVAVGVAAGVHVIEPPKGATEHWSIPKGFTFKGRATLVSVAKKDSWLNTQNFDKINLVTVPDDLHLPRKMKKGNRVTCQRSTKWKRKAARWRERNQHTFTGSLRQNGNDLTFEGCKEEEQP